MTFLIVIDFITKLKPTLTKGEASSSSPKASFLADDKNTWQSFLQRRINDLSEVNNFRIYYYRSIVSVFGVEYLDNFYSGYDWYKTN